MSRTHYKPPSIGERLVFAALFFVGTVLFGIAAVGIILLTAGNERPNPGGLACSSFLGIFAMLCLIQGCRELTGRRKKSSEESVVDLSNEFVETSSREPVSIVLPLLPKEQAEALVREVAQRHGAKKILQKLGNFRADHLAHATARFAEEMEEDETPLAFIDTSLLRNGKAGFLLTNRRLYSSFCRRPFGLADIEEVSYARPGFTEFFRVWLLGGLYYLLYGFRPIQDRLLVNGKIVCAGIRLRAEFWIELLTKLAEAARREQETSTAALAQPSLMVLETSRSPRGGKLVEVRRVCNPVWQQIEQSIRNLDGDIYPSLCLWAGAPGQAPALEILGGKGKYVLRERGDGWTYYDPNGGEEEVEICVSGAGYRCPAFYVCTDLGRVLAIARHFFELGTPE